MLMYMYIFKLLLIQMMDDAEGGKPSPHVPQLRVFRDVSGYCGVSVMYVI